MQMGHYTGGDPVEEWLDSFDRSRLDTDRPTFDKDRFHQVKSRIEAYMDHLERQRPVAYRPLSLPPYAGLQQYMQPQRVQYMQPQQAQYRPPQQVQYRPPQEAQYRLPQEAQYRPRAQQYDGRRWTVPFEHGRQMIYRVLA